MTSPLPTPSTSTPHIVVHSIDSPSDPLMPSMRQLIRDFLTELNIDMQYQAVEEELAARQHHHTPPLHRDASTPYTQSLPTTSTDVVTSPSLLSAAVPGKYSRSSLGCMLIAVDDSTVPVRPMGCVMLRALEERVGEVKRMFVDRKCRRFGVARVMMERLFTEAVELGYEKLRLDTLVRLEAANAFYRSLGFYSIPAYCYNPFDDPMFFEIHLTQRTPTTPMTS